MTIAEKRDSLVKERKVAYKLLKGNFAENIAGKIANLVATGVEKSITPDTEDHDQPNKEKTIDIIISSLNLIKQVI